MLRSSRSSSQDWQPILSAPASSPAGSFSHFCSGFPIVASSRQELLGFCLRLSNLQDLFEVHRGSALRRVMDHSTALLRLVQTQNRTTCHRLRPLGPPASWYPAQSAKGSGYLCCLPEGFWLPRSPPLPSSTILRTRSLLLAACPLSSEI